MDQVNNFATELLMGQVFIMRSPNLDLGARISAVQNVLENINSVGDSGARTQAVNAINEVLADPALSAGLAATLKSPHLPEQTLLALIAGASSEKDLEAILQLAPNIGVARERIAKEAAQKKETLQKTDADAKQEQAAKEKDAKTSEGGEGDTTDGGSQQKGKGTQTQRRSVAPAPAPAPPRDDQWDPQKKRDEES